MATRPLRPDLTNEREGRGPGRGIDTAEDRDFVHTPTDRWRLEYLVRTPVYEMCDPLDSVLVPAIFAAVTAGAGVLFALTARWLLRTTSSTYGS